MTSGPGPPIGPAGGGETVAECWDAGDLGCGELLMGLKGRLAASAPGSLLALVATDAGVAADLPPWCALTGHQLVGANRPMYLIRKRLEE